MLLTIARPAEAQWYFAGYLGANTTHAATVHVDLPAANFALAYHDVEFEARPFDSPQYYGWRVGALGSGRRRFGVEAEFIHLKVISKTGPVYATSGTVGSVPVAPGQPMSAIVERYSMTHGLNFLLVN